ncbi:MAG: Stage II sporulation protein P (SpoIIP) [Pelotomaculum sp. PtaB.Bin104]|nr:MAG: Stage II sporulation protein P (SpoIIP) [Pelotomaculum sp. PtaB.Bin104]
MLKKYSARMLVITLTAILFYAALFYISAARGNLTSYQSIAGFFQRQPEEAPEYLPGRFTTIIDEQENLLSMMSRAVYVGDKIYTSEGKIYQLDKVEGDRATAKFLGIDPQIVAYTEFYSAQEVPVTNNTDEKQSPAANLAIYHTHDAESYIPSEGTASIRFKGGIYKVGMIMAESLKKLGMEVYYDETAHDPHDNNAYVRSRRTAVKLLKTNPVAMFDVHRDGVPDPNFYRDTISNMNVAKIRLVVGRGNPRMSANLDFAKQMLTSVNNVHPKIVKEIFVGIGDYNQDLLPTALLIEAGTYTNTREEAERGIELFAEALPTALGINPVPQAPGGSTVPQQSPGVVTGSWKALGWLLGLIILAGLVFLWINAEKISNINNLKKRLLDISRELIPLVPRLTTRKPGVNIRNKRNDNEN